VAPAFQTVLTICGFVSTFSLIYIAFESRRLRIHVARTLPSPGAIYPSLGGGSGGLGGGVTASAAGYAIYVYRQGRWELESDLSAPGYEPSPPSIPGAFEAQVIKKESRPAGDS
jgi:hypothetical protein